MFLRKVIRMFIIGKTTPEKEQLVRVAKECLEIGMEAAKPYGFVGDIGHAIKKHCKKYGYGIVTDLCGHGVGLKFHEEPEVSQRYLLMLTTNMVGRLSRRMSFLQHNGSTRFL